MPTVPLAERVESSQVGREPIPTTTLLMAAATMHEMGRLIDTSGDTMDADGWMHHREKMQKERLLEHNEMKDYARSVDDIVREGSNPRADSGFTSSSPRDRKP